MRDKQFVSLLFEKPIKNVIKRQLTKEKIQLLYNIHALAIKNVYSNKAQYFTYYLVCQQNVLIFLKASEVQCQWS